MSDFRTQRLPDALWGGLPAGRLIRRGGSGVSETVMGDAAVLIGVYAADQRNSTRESRLSPQPEPDSLDFEFSIFLDNAGSDDAHNMKFDNHDYIRYGTVPALDLDI